jgi:hypothetical protein
MLKKLICFFLFFSLFSYGSQHYFIRYPTKFNKQGPPFPVSIELLNIIRGYDPSFNKYYNLDNLPVGEKFLNLPLPNAFCELSYLKCIIDNARTDFQNQKNKIIRKNAIIPFCISKEKLPFTLSKNREKLLHLSNEIFSLNKHYKLYLESDLNRLISRCIYGVYIQDTSCKEIDDIFNYSSDCYKGFFDKNKAINRVDFNLALAHFYLSKGQDKDARNYFNNGIKQFLIQNQTSFSLKDLMINYDLCDFVNTRYVRKVIKNSAHGGYDLYLSLASIFLQQARDKNKYTARDQRLVNNLFFSGVKQWWFDTNDDRSFEDMLEQYNLLSFLKRIAKLALRKKTMFSDNKLKDLIVMYTELLQNKSEKTRISIVNRIVALYKKIKVFDLVEFEKFIVDNAVPYTSDIALMILQAKLPEDVNLLNNQFYEDCILPVVNVCIYQEMPSIIDTFAKYGCDIILNNFYENIGLEENVILGLLDIYEHDLINLKNSADDPFGDHINKIINLYNRLSSVSNERFTLLINNLLAKDCIDDALRLCQEIKYIHFTDLKTFFNNYETALIDTLIDESIIRHDYKNIFDYISKNLTELSENLKLKLLQVYELYQQNMQPLSKNSKKLINKIINLYNLLDVLPEDRFNAFIDRNVRENLKNCIKIQLLKAKSVWKKLKNQEYINLNYFVLNNLKIPIKQVCRKGGKEFKLLDKYGCKDIIDYFLEQKEFLSDDSLLLLISLYAHGARYLDKKICTDIVIDCFYGIKDRNEAFWRYLSHTLNHANLENRFEIVLFKQRSKLKNLLTRKRNKNFDKAIKICLSNIFDEGFNGEKIVVLKDFGIFNLLKDCDEREINNFLRECYFHDLSLVDDKAKKKYKRKILDTYLVNGYYQEAVHFACINDMYQNAWNIFITNLSQDQQKNILLSHFFAKPKKKDRDNISQWPECKFLFYIYGSLLQHDVAEAWNYLQFLSTHEFSGSLADVMYEGLFLVKIFSMAELSKENLFSWIINWQFSSHQELIFSDVVKICANKLIKENRIEEYLSLIVSLMQNRQAKEYGLFQLVSVFMLQYNKYNNLLDLPLFASMLLKNKSKIFVKDTISNDVLGLIMYYYLIIVKINRSAMQDTIKYAEQAFLHIKNSCFFENNRNFYGKVMVLDGGNIVENESILDDLRRIMHDGISPLDATDIYLLQHMKNMCGEFASMIFEHYLSSRSMYNDEEFIKKLNEYLTVEILCNKYYHLELLFDETIVIKNKTNLINIAFNNIYLFGLVNTLSKEVLIKSINFCIDQLNHEKDSQDVSYNEIMHLFLEYLWDTYQYCPALK